MNLSKAVSMNFSRGTAFACLFTALFLCLPSYARYSGGTGDPNDPYRIATAEDLNDIGDHQEDWNKNFVLFKDVNLAQYTGTQFRTIGWWIDYYHSKPFTGVFDGNDHKIWNFTWNSTDGNCIGLFGFVEEPAQIKNLGLENVDVNVINGMYIGGLVGYNYGGTITNCYSTGSVTGDEEIGGLVGENYEGTITNCYSTTSVSGSAYTGGLVGVNWDTISSSYSKGNVLGTGAIGGLVGANFSFGLISSCYSSGSVSGTRDVGGLVGANAEAYIANCYSSASASGDNCVGGLVGWNGGSWFAGVIANCYSIGSVSGTKGYVGGLVGDSFYGLGLVEASFWDIGTSGQLTSAGGTGKTTEEMKTKSTFTDAGWDFVEIWGIGENQTYPYLMKEPAGDSNHDKKVDLLDLAVLASHWLEGKTLCPPDQASNPNPANGAANININVVLSWTPGARATSHDIYFGTQSPGSFQRNQMETTFAPGTLISGKTYYWRIDEVNFCGKTTGTVWSFKTGGKIVCFPGDTLVWLDGAPVKISEVFQSQRASISSNIPPSIYFGQIECIEEHKGAFECYDIMLENGNFISVADNHYFLLDSDRWVSVHELTHGLRLQSLNGPIAIKCVVKRAMPLVGKVYNLKIKDSDQYFVGEDGVVVRDY
jgi:hypothetical protein